MRTNIWKKWRGLNRLKNSLSKFNTTGFSNQKLLHRHNGGKKIYKSKSKISWVGVFHSKNQQALKKIENKKIPPNSRFKTMITSL
jgi:hypothetical protein